MNLDVHIIPHPDDRKDWLIQAIASVPTEAKLYFSEYVEGNPARARWLAYQKGTSEFVAGLDPDDYYLPGALAAMYKAIEANPDAVAVFCGQLAHNLETGAKEKFERPHTNAIYRREFVMAQRDLLTEVQAFDLKIAYRAVNRHKTLEFPAIGHVWRVYESKASKLRGGLGDGSRKL